MKQFASVFVFLIFISGCTGMGNSNLPSSLGEFEISPTPSNQAWFDGDELEYSYNQYEIKITSDNVPVKVMFNGKYAGRTPVKYKYTGEISVDDYVVVKAVPLDPDIPEDRKIFTGNTPLPREIHFEMKK